MRGIERLGLWESPAGLLFFDPPIAGDEAFYGRLDEKYGGHRRLAGPHIVRPEFLAAAAIIKPSARVLDVGCGEAGLRPFLPTQDYTGLDTYFGGKVPNVLRDSIEDHAARFSAHYDVICAFQVVEHVADPLAFLRHMVKALKPGGIMLVGVPRCPGPFTAIPNFVLNAPPLHLTWWSERALRVLCEFAGLGCRDVRALPFGSNAGIVYWMGRMAPNFHEDRFFKSAWSWYFALAWSFVAGGIADAFLKIPKDAPPSELLLIAEKP